MESEPLVLGSAKKQNSKFLSTGMKVLIVILLLIAAIVFAYMYVRPEPTTGNWLDGDPWGNVEIKAGDGTLVCIIEKEVHKIPFLRREVEVEYPDVSSY